MRPARRGGPGVRAGGGGWVRATRGAPAVPMAAGAAVLVVVSGAGALVYSGVGRGGAGSTATSGAAFGSEPFALSSPGAFGRLPAPGLARGNTDRPTTAAPQSATAGAAYTGPVALKWT